MITVDNFTLGNFPQRRKPGCVGQSGFLDCVLPVALVTGTETFAHHIAHDDFCSGIYGDFNADFLLGGIQEFYGRKGGVQVSFSTVSLLDVFHVFGDIFLIVVMVLRRVQSACVYGDGSFWWRNQLDSVKTITLTVANADEISADDTVGRNDVPLDFHGNVQAVETSRIVERLDIFEREAHHEILLGGIHHAEFLGNIQLFFQLKTRECLVASNIQVPGVLIFFGKTVCCYEQKKE